MPVHFTTVDAGTTANKLVQLDGSAKLPALDGSALTNLPSPTYGTGVATALAVNVGSAGAFVVFTGALGTPSSGVLTSCTGLPISTGLTGAGTGILTALAVNTGSAGAPVLFNGAGGTPSSLTLTNATGLPAAGVTGTAVTQTTLSNATLPASFTTLAASGVSTLAILNASTATTAHAIVSTAAANSFSTANVLSLKHTNNDGAAAIQLLRQSDGFEVGAVGYKNSGGTSTYLNGAVYIASGIYSSVDGSGSATVIPIIIGQESTGGINAHMTFTSAREITLHAANGTINTVIHTDGAFHLGSTGATATTSKLDVLGAAAVGDNTTQSDRNNDASGRGLLIAQNNGQVVRAVKPGVVGFDITINGSGATRRVDIIDKDNSNVVPLSLSLTGTGAVTFAGPVSGVTTLACAAITTSGVPRFNGTNTTGAGVTVIGSNCPAVTASAPYTWVQVTTSDGSTGYIPVWK